MSNNSKTAPQVTNDIMEMAITDLPEESLGMCQRDLFALCVSIISIGSFITLVAPREAPQAESREHDREAVPDGSEVAAIVARVNEEFFREWQHHGLAAAPVADDLTAARRISLALTGTIPSLEELRAFEGVSPESRLAWWIDRLLQDRRSADYIAERLARAYVGVEDGPFLIYRRRRFVHWLSDRLHENLPYHELVRQLLTADGLWTDSPAVNFFTVTANPEKGNKPDEVRLAGRTYRAFLGMRLDCMQCHDDNLNGEWSQADFHRLAAFFSDVQSSFVGIADHSQEYHFKFLEVAEEIAVDPDVPFGEALLQKNDGVRRAQLAAWVTHRDNRAFARAMVNRIWALALGRPLVQPVDDVPLDGPYPPGLEALAEDFSSHGFDLHRLWKVIFSTAPFRQESRTRAEVTDACERRWAVFPLTRLRPEQVAGALVQSARLTTIDADAHILLRLAKNEQTSDFVRRYGDTGEDEFATHGGTIPQRLLMMNGSLVKERTQSDLLANAATRVARLAPDDSAAIEAAFLSVLTRRPTAKEMEYFIGRLTDVQPSERDQFFEDLWWTMWNSTEFSWNH